MDAALALVPQGRWLDRPVPERHRLLFYAGHVEAFDWNLIGTALGLPSRHPSLDRLFAFGIDPQNGQLPDDAPSDWPSIQEITEYKMAVRRQIDNVRDRLSPLLLHIAIEHRLMHAETFTYLLHNLSEPLPSPSNPIGTPSYPASAVNLDDTMVTIPSGIATLGRQRPAQEESDGFGWDNEFDAHTVAVPSFGINRYKVTNARYLRFVEAGANPPHFWRRRGGSWYWRTLTGEIPLPPDWPVYVTHEEATAFARWSGHILPTEAQFHRAAYGTPTEEERAYPWGDSLPTPSHGNFCNCAGGNPVGVSSTPSGDSAFGVAQMVGNGWEWTSTPFAPFPGFHPYACYPVYSAPFFGGDHFVLKGASPVTAACFLRRSFRNWFRSNYRYVYASFRCVDR